MNSRRHDWKHSTDEEMYWVKNSAKGMSSNFMKFQKTMCPFKNMNFREWKDDNLWQFQVAALLKAFLSVATAAPLTWIKECTEEEFWSFLFHSIDLIHFSSTRQKLFRLRWKMSFIIVIFILFTRLGCNLKISKHLSKAVLVKCSFSFAENFDKGDCYKEKMMMRMWSACR